MNRISDMVSGVHATMYMDGKNRVGTVEWTLADAGKDHDASLASDLAGEFGLI